MISPNQIIRLIEMEAFPRLVERILANGRCETPAAIRRLQRPDAAAPAGIGLALQRICELTYRPDRRGRRLAERLLRLQCQDGLFRSRTDDTMHWRQTASLGASAVALRGLLAWRTQRAESHLSGRLAGTGPVDGPIDRPIDGPIGEPAPGPTDRALDEAIRVGVHAIAAALRGVTDAIDADIVIWQLGRAEALRRELGPHALTEISHQLDERRDAHDDLADLARAAAA